jgi:hypothetical protein
MAIAQKERTKKRVNVTPMAIAQKERPKKRASHA